MVFGRTRVICNELCVKEKAILRSEVKSRRTKRDKFLRQRKVFNREVQKVIHKFWKKKQADKEQLETSGQKSFGKKSAKLV